VDTQQAAPGIFEVKRHGALGPSNDGMPVALGSYSASNLAGSASREVHCAWPQRTSVPELDCICNPLFLHEIKASPAFSCNI
jgi:hypothetical protein